MNWILPALPPAAPRPLSSARSLPLEVDRPGGRLLQADDQPGRSWSCRSRTRRPGRTSRPRRHVEADVGHRADRSRPAAASTPAGHREVLDQMLDAQQRLPGHRRRLPRRGGRSARRGRRPPRRRPAALVRPVSGLADRVEARELCARAVSPRSSRLLLPAVRPARTGSAARTGSPAAGGSGPAAAPGMEYSRSPAARLPCPAAPGTAPRCRGAGGWRTACRCRSSPTISPAYMTATRSARPAITPRSWVTRITDIPSRCRRSSISSRICFWIVTSSAVVGSSAISSLGSQASAMAIMTRCRIPPENWCGYSPSRSPGLRHPDQAEHLDRALHGLPPVRPRGAAGPPRRSACRRSSSGSARSSGPGRSSRSRCRGCCASASSPSPLISPPVQVDASRRDVPADGQQAHDRQRGHRLAAAGLADDAEALARVHGAG